MAISNGTAHITRRLSIYIAELADKRRLAKDAKAASVSLPDLTTEITRLVASWSPPLRWLKEELRIGDQRRLMPSHHNGKSHVE